MPLIQAVVVYVGMIHQRQIFAMGTAHRPVNVARCDELMQCIEPHAKILSLDDADYFAVRSMRSYQVLYRMCLNSATMSWTDRILECPVVGSEIVIKSLVAIERLEGYEAAISILLELVARVGDIETDNIISPPPWVSLIPFLLGSDIKPLLKRNMTFYVSSSTSDLSNRPLQCYSQPEARPEVATHRSIIADSNIVADSMTAADYCFIPLYFSCMDRLRVYGPLVKDLFEQIFNNLSCGNLPRLLVLSEQYLPFLPREEILVVIPQNRSDYVRSGSQIHVPAVDFSFFNLIEILCMQFFYFFPSINLELMVSTPPMVLTSSFKNFSDEAVAPHGVFDLNVMTLNAWLIPVRPAFPACLDFHALTRAKRMASWLEEQVSDHRLDIAILQEVWTPWRSFVACTIHSAFCCRLFGRSLIEASISQKLPYITRVKGSRPCDCSKRFFDSGLVIASRFPILMEDFLIYPSGSPHDALSSKGILVTALYKPGSGIIIVASSHLDAGDDDDLKLRQLEIALKRIAFFTQQVSFRFPEKEIAATIFGSDMNIDGVEFWSETSSYASARRRLESEGFQDSWLLTPRAVPHPDDIASKNYNPDSHPQLGITSDQHKCVKRLDYLWVCPGPVGSPHHAVPAAGGAAAPAQQGMVDMHKGSSKKQIKRFGVSAKTELNDGVLWRSSEAMRAEVDEAVKKGQPGLAKKLSMKIDLHDREMRLSDHAALFAKLHFFPHSH